MLLPSTFNEPYKVSLHVTDEIAPKEKKKRTPLPGGKNGVGLLLKWSWKERANIAAGFVGLYTASSLQSFLWISQCSVWDLPCEPTETIQSHFSCTGKSSLLSLTEFFL